MNDLISRQAAIDAIMGQPPEPHYPAWYAAQIEKLPAVQPDHVADIGKKVCVDTISRQAAIDGGVAVHDSNLHTKQASGLELRRHIKVSRNWQWDRYSGGGKKRSRRRTGKI